MANQEVDRSKRRFLVAATSVAGGVAAAAVPGNDVEQMHRHAGIRDMRGDAAAHHARAHDDQRMRHRLELEDAVGV